MKTTNYYKIIALFTLLVLTIYRVNSQTITAINTTKGSLNGGTEVTLLGSGFDQKKSVGVFFENAANPNGIQVSTVIFKADTIKIRTPNQSKPGTFSVYLELIKDAQKIYAPETFEYKLPEIDSLSKTSSSTKGKETIKIKGKYLSGTNYVNFGTSGNPPTTVNDTVVTVKNPPHVTGKVGVQVKVQGAYSAVTKASEFWYANKSTSYKVSLNNSTGLASKYKVYVLGFSTSSQKELVVNSKKEASFAAISSKTGYIKSYELGKEITSISLSNANPIIGARIYFFIVDTTKKYKDNSKLTGNGNLGFSYTQKGKSVIQVDNPPQTAFPQYSYVEATFKKNQGLYFDVSTVDGFYFPISILAQNSKGKELDRVGQSKGITAADVTNAYKPFMKQLKADKEYNNLSYVLNSDLTALLNPGLYLENNTSTLETVFDDALKTLFTDKSLKMNIWQNGNNSYQKNYTVTPVVKTFPGTSNSHQALEFTSANATTLHVFNPVGFSVVSYLDTISNTRKPILGSISNNILTFKTPLPDTTGLEKGMYVSNGGGATDGVTQITAITKVNKMITSVTLNSSTDYPSSFQYKFSKAPKNYYYSSGQMTFAGIGLFADGALRYTDSNLQVIVKGLENQISTALNRGVATVKYQNNTGNGHTTKNWGLETNWYPAGQPQNLFSYFMHTATSGGKTIFSLPKKSVKSARGDLMAKAYGFAYDENPIGNSINTQPQVPSEFPGSFPKGTTKFEIILGSWK